MTALHERLCSSLCCAGVVLPCLILKGVSKVLFTWTSSQNNMRSEYVVTVRTWTLWSILYQLYALRKVSWNSTFTSHANCVSQCEVWQNSVHYEYPVALLKVKTFDVRRRTLPALDNHHLGYIMKVTKLLNTAQYCVFLY